MKGKVIVCLVLALLTGCACPPHPASASSRRFAYAKELVWEYRYDANGHWTTRRREVRPSYSQHCFVVSRSACQFFENAVFDPSLRTADDETYRRLVRRLVSTNLRRPLPKGSKITIPGY